MNLNETNKISIAVLFSLAIGLIIGYSLGVKKIPHLQEIVFSNPAADTNKPKPENINLSAKEAYDLAWKESRLWPDDTQLTSIELISKNFSNNGLSNGWKVTFYSKLKEKSFEVTIRDGESRGTIEKDSSVVAQTLKGDFIDSSVLAKSFFGAYPDSKNDIISLKMYYDAGSKKFLWTIFFPKGSHTIDAEM